MSKPEFYQKVSNTEVNNRTTYSSPRQIPGTTWRYAWGAFAGSWALKDAD